MLSKKISSAVNSGLSAVKFDLQNQLNKTLPRLISTKTKVLINLRDAFIKKTVILGKSPNRRGGWGHGGQENGKN